jgi:hypothetical protein
MGETLGFESPTVLKGAVSLTGKTAILIIYHVVEGCTGNVISNLVAFPE